MATPRTSTTKATKAKVIQIRVDSGSGIAEELERALNEFLESEPKATVQSTQMHMLDIGGPSQADIVVVCVIFYSL